jgi:alkylresorcinol/alkylpyrone synthase
VASALPAHAYDQEALISAFRDVWGQRHFNTERFERLHRNVLVGGRRLALPLDRYPELRGFGDANQAWLEAGLALATTAVPQALEDAGLGFEHVGMVISTSVTGVAAPSLEARLMNRLPFRRDCKRLPLFGLGCVAGAAGLARAADYVRAFPDQAAVLLSIELCSLTLQRDDLSIANLIATGLFGDGAAAAVVVGEELAARCGIEGPRVVGTQATFYPDTEAVMGWRISERGFSIVLSAAVPEMAERHLGDDVDRLLSVHKTRRDEIDEWIAHPGGPKVLEAMRRALELPAAALERTWRSLREVGNVSSTSVLLVLEEVLASRPAPGSRGLVLAMGPGFCSELVLLEW